MRLIFFTTILILLTSCDQFHYSPFVVGNEEYNYNKAQLERLDMSSERTSEVYKIAFISDTHNDYSSFNDFVDYINAHSSEYAFVIHCGDLTTFSTKREFEQSRKILSKLKVPFFVTSGNHDLIANGSSLFKKYFHSSELSFSFRNTLFVLYSDNNWEDNGAPNLKWIEKQLQESTDVWKVLITHIPPRQAERFSRDEIDRFDDLLYFYNVDYIASGHIHSDGAFGKYSDKTRKIDAGHTTRLRRFKALVFDGVSIDEKTISY